MTKGSEEALGELYQRHAGRVFVLARRIVGDARVAEDVVESVFLALWDRPAAHDPRQGSLRALLLLEARRRSLDLAADHAEGDARSAALSEPEGEVTGGPHALSPEERRIVELVYFGGLTCREVAERLGIPEEAVRDGIGAGLARLRSAAGSVAPTAAGTS